MLHRSTIAVCLVATSYLSALADGPKDNLPNNVRPVPPIGLEVTGTDRRELESGLARLDMAIEGLRRRADANTKALLPDVEIFARAIRQGLEHRELFSPLDVANAKQVLAEGLRRAADLSAGDAPWTVQKGLVVRGFRSRIDGTVQPYGLVVPDSYSTATSSRYRLDLWFHGRGERMSESPFIADRMKNPGRYTPRDTIVLHPYGRYSNAFKFAGEVDVLEALEHAKANYRIDEDRIAVRGFSMGGAGCWQMAVHYPDLFFAANPGAGFSETPEFLKFFQQETLAPTWYERKLWRMYDCPGYAANLYQLPTVAYSGELDIQKQAADIMEVALRKEGLRLMHVIGPQTKHSIEAGAMRRIESKLDLLAKQGRPALPMKLRFATYTLKYDRVYWMTLTELEEHWEQATVDAEIDAAQSQITLSLNRVRGFKLTISAGDHSLAPDREITLVVNDATLETPSQIKGLPRPATDGSWEAEFHREGGQWKVGPRNASGLVKRHDLQGPIDDAFMDSFILVRPSGTAAHENMGRWAEAELERVVREWRRQFRGDAIVKRDEEITEKDIEHSHLILFGDRASNSIIDRLIDRMPLTWDAKTLVIGNRKYDPATHAPIMIYPNSENPARYIVLNSGFTYREYAYLNNARQVPKLPDWAIVDLRQPPNSLWPGKIVEADFFDEQWRIRSR